MPALLLYLIITVDHPKHAFSANGLMVKNCGGAIDELGWFKVGDGADEAVTISADENASIANSITTVRTAANRLLEVGENAAQQGIMFNVSSPKSAFDKITTLVRKNRDSKLVLALNLPTWEYNPQVTRAYLQIYFDNDPIKAERDYGVTHPYPRPAFSRTTRQSRQCSSDYITATVLQREESTASSAI